MHPKLNGRAGEQAKPNYVVDSKSAINGIVLDAKSPAESQIASQSFRVKALYLGEHIHLRSVLRSKRLATQQPASIQLDENGLALLYRYGSVVLFNSTPHTEEEFLRRISPFVTQSYERPETEELLVRVDSQRKEAIENGALIIGDASNRRLEIVAAVLSKSVALAQYEADVTTNFDHIEPFALQLERSGRGGHNMRQILRHIGRALLNEHKMVARVEVTDRPELLWDHPELEQLYLRLEDEFELQERAAILDRKLDLISRTANTVLDLLQKRRSSRVEWYIVFLIVLEIALSIYGIFPAR